MQNSQNSSCFRSVCKYAENYGFMGLVSASRSAVQYS
jgi:hypothetical protein